MRLPQLLNSVYVRKMLAHDSANGVNFPPVPQSFSSPTSLASRCDFRLPQTNRMFVLTVKSICSAKRALFPGGVNNWAK